MIAEVSRPSPRWGSRAEFCKLVVGREGLVASFLHKQLAVLQWNGVYILHILTVVHSQHFIELYLSSAQILGSILDEVDVVVGFRSSCSDSVKRGNAFYSIPSSQQNVFIIPTFQLCLKGY